MIIPYHDRLVATLFGQRKRLGSGAMGFQVFINLFESRPDYAKLITVFCTANLYMICLPCRLDVSWIRRNAENFCEDWVQLCWHIHGFFGFQLQLHTFLDEESGFGFGRNGLKGRVQ